MVLGCGGGVGGGGGVGVEICKRRARNLAFFHALEL